MTKPEFDRVRQIYFERCAGCHGVLLNVYSTTHDIY